MLANQSTAGRSEPPTASPHARRVSFKQRLTGYCAASAAIASSLVLYLGVGRSAGGPDSLYAEPGVLDLGVVPGGDEVFASFRVVNPSDQAAQIIKITAGCSCTAPDWDPQTLVAAHSSLEIPLTVRVPVADDTVYSTVTVEAQHLRNKAGDGRGFMRVTVTGRVLHDYVVSRTGLDFGAIDGRNPVERQLYLDGQGRSDIKITGVACTHESFSASARQVHADSNRWQINVRLAPFEAPPHGVGEAHPIIDTDSPRRPRARVRLY